MRSSGHRDPDRRQDRRGPAHPHSPGRSGTEGQGGPGTVQAAGRHNGAAHSGVDTPRGGGRRRSPAPRAPLRAKWPAKGHLLFRLRVPGAAGFVRGGSSRSVTGPRAGHKGGADASRPRPSPGRPAAPRGRPPGGHKGRARGSPEARRVLDALLELHRHGCGAALTGSSPAAPRAASSAARPARPPARAALRARPPRNEAAAPPPRPACHRRGASPKSAARGRRPLSPPGSVAKRPALPTAAGARGSACPDDLPVCPGPLQVAEESRLRSRGASEPSWDH